MPALAEELELELGLVPVLESERVSEAEPNPKWRTPHLHHRKQTGQRSALAR